MAEFNLNQQDLEAALRVVDQAWLQSENRELETSIPPRLQHLSKEQWEEVCLLLNHLNWQRNYSPLH